MKSVTCMYHHRDGRQCDQPRIKGMYCVKHRVKLQQQQQQQQQNQQQQQQQQSQQEQQQQQQQKE